MQCKKKSFIVAGSLLRSELKVCCAELIKFKKKILFVVMDKKIRAPEQGRLRAKRHRTLQKLRDDLSNNTQNVDCKESGVMDAYKLNNDAEGNYRNY